MQATTIIAGQFNRQLNGATSAKLLLIITPHRV
jgi:hypothetical protein